MVTSKVLNPERSKKKEGNRKTLACRHVDHFQVPSQLLCTISLSVHSEHCIVTQKFTEVIPVQRG